MRRLLPLLLAGAACAQWLVLRLGGVHPSSPLDALLPGLCVVGAAFLMTWAAETAELDLPQNVAVGLLALLAVLPEYAVDMYFAWKAGRDPSYAAYAAANMTGANRLLIGVGWPAVALACWWRRGERAMEVSGRNAVELFVLLAATAYSFVLPFKATLSLGDSAVLVGLFGLYVWLSAAAGVEEPELEGTAELLSRLPVARRRAAVTGLFIFAGAGIAAAAGPFAEGVLATGRRLGLEEFLLVQWLAPLASEAPEFIVAMIFALKGRPAVGMRALLSSKVNQWTLLVGMLPLAYCASARSTAPLRLDARQVDELLLTSAQSLFGLVALLDFEFTLREAGALLVLFAAQMFFPHPEARRAFAWLYVALAAGLFLLQERRRGQLMSLTGRVLRRR